MLLPLLLNNLLADEGGDEHNLAATSVESDSEVSSPSLGQVHALAATSVQSLSQLTSPTIGQIHALAATSVQSASEVSEPDLEALSEHALTATSVQSLSQVSNPALAQIHVLSAASVQSLSSVTRPSLGEPQAESVGGHYYPTKPPKKAKDYRPELDEKRLRERQELRDLIERAAGLIDDAIEQAPEQPEVAQQATALNIELGKLREYAEAIQREPGLALSAVQERVDGLIAKAVDDLIVQIADVLTDLIQEIAEDE